MKIIYTIIFLHLSLLTYSQIDTTVQSNIYFIRATGFTGSARQFKLFIDGNLICKIYNNNYLILEIPPGKHSFAVQMDGQQLKEKTRKIELLTEVGKNYYLASVLETNEMWSKTYIDELTENSGKAKIARLEKATCKE